MRQQCGTDWLRWGVGLLLAAGLLAVLGWLWWAGPWDVAIGGGGSDPWGAR